MKIDPFLSSQSKSREDLAKELHNDNKKGINLDIPCLGNLIARKTSNMSPYTVPRSGGIFKTLADVINKKHFKGIYPESFSTVPRYFRDTGISPYYEVIPGNDYSPGVLTISTMIELTASGYKWQLSRDQDVGLIIGISEAYRDMLKRVLRPESNRTEDIRNLAYAEKLDKFLKIMHAYANKLLKQKNANVVKVYSLTEIMAMFEQVGD